MSDTRLDSTTPKPSYHRLVGLDLARGLAVIGMVLVNFMYVFSHDHVTRLVEDASALQSHSPLGLAAAAVVFLGFAGRAVSVFLVLFGIGLTLQARRAEHRPNSPWPAPQARRYLLLMIGGMALLPIWEADILHFIGLFGLLVLFLVRLRTPWLLTIGAAVLVGAELLRIWFDYAAGWSAGAIGSHYEDMWSLAGQLRQLFFNGYHPVFPWISLVIYGLCLGRLDLKDRSTLQRLTFLGVLAAVAGFTMQTLGVPAEFFPADTLFILLGMANSTWVIAACLLFCGAQRPRGVVQNMGRLALSHYPGHVLLGIVPVVVLLNEKMDMAFEKSFAVAALYLVVTAVLGQIWFRYRVQGPLEWALRVASSRPITGWTRRRDETAGMRTE